MEVFKDIVGYEGLYQISNMGNVKSVRNNKYLKPSKINSGYLRVSLGRHGSFLVHRLVGQAFIPNPDNLPCINHKNNDKTDNRLSNLEYCSYHYNNTYGTHKQLQRESHINNLENSKRAKSVNQYSLDNKYIKTFLSARRASEELNVCLSGIIRCCKGQLKTCGGYIWRYKEMDCT